MDDEKDLAELAEQVETEIGQPEPTDTVGDLGIEAPKEAPSEIPEPLEHWTQLQKDRYAALSDEIKPAYIDEVKTLDAAYNERFQEVARHKETADALDQIFSPIGNVLTANGISRTDAIKELVGWYQLLQQDPAGALSRLAQTYGVSLQQPSGEDSDELFQDPRINQLEQQIGQLSGLFQQNATAQQVQQRGNLEAQLNAFRTAKGPDDNLSYPYFEDVRQVMGSMVQAAHMRGTPMDLPTAYEQAVWAHPETRQRLLEDQSKGAAKKREDERKKSVAKAKQADQVNVTSSPETSTPAKKPKNVRDDVVSAYRELAAAS